MWIFKALVSKISLQKSLCKKPTKANFQIYKFSVVNPNDLTKELNLKFSPPLKNSNSIVDSDSSVLPTFSTNSSISLLRSLKVSARSLIVSSTSGKILCSCFDNCFCPMGGRGIFFGVVEIVLFFWSVISVMGLEKLFIFGLEGRGEVNGSLLRNGETLPSGVKKLVSLGVFDGEGGKVVLGVMGGKWTFWTLVDNGGKSRS